MISIESMSRISAGVTMVSRFSDTSDNGSVFLAPKVLPKFESIVATVEWVEKISDLDQLQHMISWPTQLRGISGSGRESVMPLKKSSGVIAGIPYLNIEEQAE